MKQIFIDLEWKTGKKPLVFLLSWYKNQAKNGFLYGRVLNATNIKKILNDIDYIFVFGPDVGWLENKFDLELKDNFYCINLHKAFKRLKPRLKNHTLANIEKHYKIKRKTGQIKNERNNLYNLWLKDPELVKEYCAEDSFNLKLVYEKLKAEKNMQRKDFLEFRLT